MDITTFAIIVAPVAAILGFFLPALPAWNYVDLVYYPLGLIGAVLFALSTEREAEVARLTFNAQQLEFTLDNERNSLDRATVALANTTTETERIRQTKPAIDAFSLNEMYREVPKFPIGAIEEICKGTVIYLDGTIYSPCIFAQGSNVDIIRDFSVTLKDGKIEAYVIPVDGSIRCQIAKEHVKYYEFHLISLRSSKIDFDFTTGMMKGFFESMSEISKRCALLQQAEERLTTRITIKSQSDAKITQLVTDKVENENKMTVAKQKIDNGENALASFIRLGYWPFFIVFALCLKLGKSLATVRKQT